MTNKIDRNLIRSIFLNDIPVMDVRAPVEFSQGAFPNAVNYPLLTDEERHQVGICYKQQGQDAAIALGQKLVSGAVREERLQNWKQFATQHPGGYLYCFRGGLRSRTIQQWLQETGIHLPLIQGGYKAMRRFLIDELEQSIHASVFVVLGGQTGTGKTYLLKELSYSVDLEALANHRGSSFGRLPAGQPEQIDFENKLSIQLMKYHAKGINHFWLEDESRLIGQLILPESLQVKMKQAPIVMLEEDINFRINIIIKDYVVDLLGLYESNTGNHELAFNSYAQYMLDSLERIKKRLGGVLYKELNTLMQYAIDQHNKTGEVSGYKPVFEQLLTRYYDPMYNYQMEKKQQRIIFTGNAHQILMNQNKLLDVN
jgi:tRNA 2-selenouridine synthase